MNIKELINWAKIQSIEEKTIDSFKEFLVNYEKDDSEEYNSIFKNINKNNLEYEIHRVSLNLGNWPDCTYNTVSARMWVSYKGKLICVYETLYNFDGTPEDAFFDVI